MKAFGEYLVVKLLPKQSSTGGIIIPDNVENETLEAEVLSVGGKVNDIKTGDVVIVDRPHNQYKDDIYFVDQIDIFAILD